MGIALTANGTSAVALKLPPAPISQFTRPFNFTPFVVAALLFLAVSIPLTRAADYLLAKERRAMSGTAVR